MRVSNRFAVLAGAAMLLLSSAALAEGGASADKAACNSDHGQQVFRRCMSCHTLQPGVNRMGPSLWHLFGRKSGTVEGFNYSQAMKDAGIVWDEKTLDAYLADPRGDVPHNRMPFPGVRDPQERADLICFLKDHTH